MIHPSLILTNFFFFNRIETFSKVYPKKTELFKISIDIQHTHMRIPTLFYLPSQKISSKAYQLVSSVIISQIKKKQIIILFRIIYIVFQTSSIRPQNNLFMNKKKNEKSRRYHKWKLHHVTQKPLPFTINKPVFWVEPFIPTISTNNKKNIFSRFTRDEKCYSKFSWLFGLVSVWLKIYFFIKIFFLMKKKTVKRCKIILNVNNH